MRQLRVGLAAVVVLAAACASTGQRPGDTGGDPSRITAAELQAAPVGNLADYIQLHRPRWLERNYAPVMASNRIQGLVVFMDNQEYGGPETLRTIATTSVREVRYYSPSEAQARFGPGYINGVIQVLTSGR